MQSVRRVDSGVSGVRGVGEGEWKSEIRLACQPPIGPRRQQKGCMWPWSGEHHTLSLFPPARELLEMLQKVIGEGGKGVIVVPVRKKGEVGR